MFIAVGDTKIFAVEFGQRDLPALVAIGGWIGSWELWLEPFARLSEEWHTIAYDHRGVGATVAPIESIGFERMVDDVIVVLDAFGIEACVLAAESAGAITALGAALKYPERVTGLALVDGLYFREKVSESDPFLMGLKHAYAATLDAFVEACVPEPDSEHIKNWGRQILDRAGQEAAIALYVRGGETDLRDKLGQVTQPTLLIHGEADAILPVASTYRLAEQLPNCKVVVLPGAGHVPTMTQARRVAREITDFFSGTLRDL